LSTNSIHQRFTLQAIERLKLRQQIETLFQTGEAFSVFPLRVIYRICAVSAAESPVRVGFSIPKKRIKKAVGRNRVRRRLKEAWRLQKHSLYRQVPAGSQLHLFLVYTGPENCSFDEAVAAVRKVNDKLYNRINPGNR
jgi:ribonuclease P protein component